MVFEVRAPEFEECESGEAGRVAVHNALGKAQRRGARGRMRWCWASTRSCRWRSGCGASRQTTPRRARRCRRCPGARTPSLSAIALLGPDDAPRTATCATAVTFRRLDADTIEWYVRSGEWRERAGGYAIQGAGCALVAAIAGDWTNVVGLPVGTLLDAYPSLLAA